jgi:hypothetical protein
LPGRVCTPAAEKTDESSSSVSQVPGRSVSGEVDGECVDVADVVGGVVEVVDGGVVEVVDVEVDGAGADGVWVSVTVTTGRGELEEQAASNAQPAMPMPQRTGPWIMNQR